MDISERFTEAVQLLCYTFGWPQVREVPRINVNEPEEIEYRFTEKDHEIARAYNQIDLEL